MIVHAGANRVPTRVVVHAVQADAEVVAPAAVAARHVRVQVFGLRRPVRHEHPLSAAASGPARLRRRLIAVPAAIAALNVSIGEAARAVDQQRRHNRQAETAADRAEPRNAGAATNPTRNVNQLVTGVDVGQVAILRARAAAHRGALEVGFRADQSAHAAQREAADLVVIADLAAADHAARTRVATDVVGDAAVHAVEVPDVAVAAAGAPAAADVQTGVEARPHRGRGRGRQDRSLARGKVSGERRTRQNRQRDGR